MNLTGKITSSRMFTGHMVLWCSENIMVRYFSLKNVLFFEYDDHILILNISFYSLHLAQGSVGITRPSHDCTAKTWGWGYKMNFWMIQNKTEIFLKHLVNPQQFDLLEKDEEAFKDAIENRCKKWGIVGWQNIT